MKPLCKICPQLAVCLLQPNSDALDERGFYPRRIYPWLEDELVFECFAPHRTGETGPSNGGGPIDIFRVPSTDETKSLL